jgi:hypothetical protein
MTQNATAACLNALPRSCIKCEVNERAVEVFTHLHSFTLTPNGTQSTLSMLPPDGFQDDALAPSCKANDASDRRVGEIYTLFKYITNLTTSLSLVEDQ